MTELVLWAVLAAACLALVWLGWRREFAFWRILKRNRAAGMYDDPAFKKRIKPLNIQRYSLLAIMIMSLCPSIWLFQARADLETWVSVFAVLFVPAQIGLHLVNRRWRKLMTDGVS